MVKLFYILLLISVNSFSADLLENCRFTSDQMNKLLPRQIDNITILNKTYCVKNKGKIYFQFDHTILNPNKLPGNIKKIAKSAAKLKFCSGEYRDALDYLSYDFYYLDGNVRPLFSFTIQKDDC